MTQAARVALWVPTVLPSGVGNAIETTGAPTGAQAPVPSTFVDPGALSVPYATDPEIQAGTLATKAVSPLGLRTDLNRLLGLPPADMSAGPVIAVSTNVANRLVKTDSAGMISTAMLAGVVDGGTF